MENIGYTVYISHLPLLLVYNIVIAKYLHQKDYSYKTVF
jgi:hypothetical protein